VRIDNKMRNIYLLHLEFRLHFETKDRAHCTVNFDEMWLLSSSFHEEIRLLQRRIISLVIKKANEPTS
jgi:hypothetical protein